MKILTIISARGGSKRIPKKNIKKFCGKPLIVWTIEAAIKAKKTSRIIVSTDDKEIAKIATKHGAEVPFLRSKDLAQDNTPGIEPVLDMISKIKGYDWILLLQPTSPLRDENDIDDMINFTKEKKSLSTVSVNKFQDKIKNLFFKDKRFRLLSIFGSEFYKEQPLKNNEPYILNGAMYLSNINFLIRKNSFVTNATIGYVMPLRKSIDIDTQIDWDIAKYLKQNDKK